MTDIHYECQDPIETTMSSDDVMDMIVSEALKGAEFNIFDYVNKLGLTDTAKPSDELILDSLGKLSRYGFITSPDLGVIKISDDGILVKDLPLSYRAAAALAEAYNTGTLSLMLPLVALIEINDIRYSHKDNVKGAVFTGSDPIQQVMTLAQNFVTDNKLMTKDMRTTAQRLNVDLRQYNDYCHLLWNLQQYTQTHADWQFFAGKMTDDLQSVMNVTAKQILFRAFINNLYPALISHRRLAITPIDHNGTTFTSAGISTTSNCTITLEDFPLLYSGNLRMVTPKVGTPFMVLEQVTVYDKELPLFISRFGFNIFKEIEKISTHSNLKSALDKISAPVPQEILKTTSATAVSSDEPEDNSVFTTEVISVDTEKGKDVKTNKDFMSDPTPVEVTDSVGQDDKPVKRGTLGDLLQAAFDNKK